MACEISFLTGFNKIVFVRSQSASLAYKDLDLANCVPI